jgi:hypothetical protein
MTLVQLYWSTNKKLNGSSASSNNVTYAQMVEAIKGYNIQSDLGYLNAVATTSKQSEVTYQNLLNDYELALRYFKDELENDFKNAKESYTESPYKEHPEFKDEVFCFMFAWGKITPVYAKKPGKNEDDLSKIVKFEYGYNHEAITTKEAAIEKVYSDTVTQGLDMLLLSTATASKLNTEFTAKAKLEYFDPEMAENAINNRNSLLYSRGSRIPYEDRKMLYEAIFIDGTISVNVCAAFQLSIGGGVNTRGHHSFGEEFAGYMPHPHIDEYNCMGDYVRIVNELMQRHDYIMALEQCIASARSLNFADSTVLGHFIRTLMDDNDRSRCLSLPDGRIVKPSDAVKWLKEKKAESK